MRKEQVHLRVVYKSTKQPNGCFEAVFWDEGRSRTKQCSLAVHGEDIAYDTVVLWAQDRAKEYGLTYMHKSKDELLKMLDLGGNRGVPGEKKEGKEVLVRSNLGNIKLFKAEILRAYDAYGLDKIKSVIDIGLSVVSELELERQKASKNTEKAKTSIAQNMFLVYQETGVDPTQFCTDDEINNEFNRLVGESIKS